MLLASAGRDGLGDRVLGGILERAGQPEHLVGVLPMGGDPAREGHPPGGDGAGLVQHDGVDPAGGFQDLGALDQDPELGAALVVVLAATSVLVSTPTPGTFTAPPPPPPNGVAVPGGGLAGQVGVKVVASEGQVVVRLATPKPGNEIRTE